MKTLTKTYTHGDLTIVWQPDLCQHTGICFRGLPLVFDPRRKPWIEADAADIETIKKQIQQCPSKALSYRTNPESKQSS